MRSPWPSLESRRGVFRMDDWTTAAFAATCDDEMANGKPDRRDEPGKTLTLQAENQAANRGLPFLRPAVAETVTAWRWRGQRGNCASLPAVATASSKA